MADNAPRSSNSGLAFIVGGLVVAVAVLAWLFMGGESGGNNGDVSVTIDGGGDAVEGAADAVEGAAEAVGDAATGN